MSGGPEVWRMTYCPDRSTIPVVDEFGRSLFSFRNRPENLRRARIATSAPELLRACQMALAALAMREGEAVDALRAAIDKATAPAGGGR